MVNQKNSNNYLVLWSALFFLVLAFWIHSRSARPIIEVSKQESATNLNRDLLRFLSLGNKRLIADVLWIQTLMESDFERYQQRDLGSWMYLRFLTIAALDPAFYENYYYGGLYLSIVKDDLEGAADLIERGLRIYPDDYKLNYHGGFNYYFEMGDYENGLRLLEKIIDHPEGSKALAYIVNKLKFETEQNYDAALMFLQHRLENTKDPVLGKKLTSDIYALKAQRDLECLNQGLKSCDAKDAFGRPYIKKDGQWKAQQEFKPYKIFRRQ